MCCINRRLCHCQPRCRYQETSEEHRLSNHRDLDLGFLDWVTAVTKRLMSLSTCFKIAEDQRAFQVQVLLSRMCHTHDHTCLQLSTGMTLLNVVLTWNVWWCFGHLFIRDVKRKWPTYPILRYFTTTVDSNNSIWVSSVSSVPGGEHTTPTSTLKNPAVCVSSPWICGRL